MITLDDYIADFGEEPGYLDFARFGPIGSAVRSEGLAQGAMLEHARFGTIAALDEQDERFRVATAAVTGFRADQVVFQPSRRLALLHATFGLTGVLALTDHSRFTIPAARASDALGVLRPHWLAPDHGRVTPSDLRDLDSSVTAVAVTLVDPRTGYTVDLEGIRQVIGDRLLIVDAHQGFGVVDAPLDLADVVVSGGHAWLRSGPGTGFMALSDRAVDELTPVFTDALDDAVDVSFEEPLTPDRTAAAYRGGHPDPVAQARMAAALERLAEVGVSAVQARVAEVVSAIIDLADEFALPVVSPRDEAERAGIVVFEPQPEQVTTLVASLHNHGVTATAHTSMVRVSPHVSTDQDTLGMLRDSMVSFSTAITH